MGLFSSSQTTTSGPTGSGLDLYNTLQNYYSQAMKTTPDFINAYETGGLNAIKRGTDANSAAIGNVNASYGIRGPAAGYATMVPRIAGQGQVTNLETSLPMVRNQYQQSVMDRSAQGVQLGPHEQTTKTNPSTFSNLATILAGMYGMKSGGDGSSPSYFPTTQGMGNGPGISSNPIGLANLPVDASGYYIPGGG